MNCAQSIHTETAEVAPHPAAGIIPDEMSDADSSPLPSDNCDSSGIPAAEPLPGAPRDLAALTDLGLIQLAQSGDFEALDLLLRRHWSAFRRHAEQVCNDPTQAQDLCQEACLKAIVSLPRLRCPDAFCAWVKGFITNEARTWRRNSKKVGTPFDEMDTSLVEPMIVPAPIQSPADFQYLVALLWQQARKQEGACRATAAFMLEYYRQEQAFPPVRTIAEATHSSQGTAQRCREAILRAWRRTLSAFDLLP